MNNNASKTQPFKKLAQLGYSARGVVYLVIGGLAVMAAFGGGGKTTGSKGAIMTILNQPFGNIMLTILVIGLAGYVLWRLIQSVKDTDHHGHSGKGLAIRAGLFVSAITHAALAIWAVKLMLGSSSSGGSGSGSSFLSSNAGMIVYVLAGIAVIGAGIANIVKGWKARFEKHMTIPGDKRSWARPLCQFGLIARGVVWCMIGVFFIRSAMRASSGDVKGISDALNALASSSYGPWLLGIVALGLMAFGIYSIIEALYRRINTPEPV